MKIGESKFTNMILRMIDSSCKENIEEFINSLNSKEFRIFNSFAELKNVFEKKFNKISCFFK